ncbi:MAG TPA: tetratricopeptide repeat protein [Anaerolineales bacterium]|nr:tetratricopeptide repeat protein [Anaerolineales bacterium]
MGAPRAIALCQCFNGALEFQAGHWTEAESVLRESIKLYHELGAASGEALALQRLGTLLTARGRLDEALTLLEEGVTVAGRAVMRAHCLTRLYASMTHNRLMAGEIEAAGHYLSLGLDMSDRHGHCATCHALLYPVAVSVHITRGALSRAEAFCRQLEQASSEYQSRAWVAMARQARGELAAAQNDLETALTCYEEASQAFKATGNQYEAARCLTAMAEIRRQRKLPGDARIAKSQASEAGLILERLNAA